MKVPIVLRCPHCLERMPRMIRLADGTGKGHELSLMCLCQWCGCRSGYRGKLGNAIAQTKRLGYVWCDAV